MATRNPRNLVLTGISTSGKSTVGRQLSERLGLTFVDLDASVERAAGRPIAEIFSYEGEKGFRDLETAELRRALSAGNAVISTGGGVVLRKENRQLIEAEGIVICLDAQADTVFVRLGGNRPRRPGRPIRPLLDGPNPMDRITDMKRERAYWYSLSDWTIHTDFLRVEEVVNESERAWEILRDRIASGGPPPLRPARSDQGTAPVVTTPGGSYPLYVGSGLLDNLGRKLLEHGLLGRVFILADEHAAAIHGRRALDFIRSAGLTGEIFTIPSGDQSKDLGLARQIYDWLGERKAERRETIVAFGGGVAGDLGGYVAATWLRGVPLVQVPTTLLAMTDSSIGGKVGVNLPFGKNLVGAFYQPRFVLADVEALASLGRREVIAGWAETIKHGLIRDLDLLERLERGADQLLGLDRSLLSDVIRRSSAVKATVVSSDEREDGLRMLLNYGHTIGHALEAAGNYSQLLHGEAVAIGMTGAARIARELGMLTGDEVERQAKLIGRFGLPDRTTMVPMEKITAALAMDKKVQAKKLRWILLNGIANATTRQDVPAEIVDRTIWGLIE